VTASITKIYVVVVAVVVACQWWALRECEDARVASRAGPIRQQGVVVAIRVSQHRFPSGPHEPRLHPRTARLTTSGLEWGIPMPSDGSAVMSVPNVRAIRDGFRLMCELPNGRRFTVPTYEIAHGSEVWRPGDYGTLLLRRDFAQRAGLTSPPT
jgi:hypothetical protein